MNIEFVWKWLSDNAVPLLFISIIAFLLLLYGGRQIQKALSVNRRGVLRGIYLVLRFLEIISLAAVLLTLVAVIIAQQDIGLILTPLSIQRWVLEHGIPILAITVIALLLYRFLQVMIPRIIERAAVIRGRERRARDEQVKRLQTLSGIISQTIGIFIVIIAIFMVLSQLNFDIAPLLASAGVAGIAIGFGAQSLIKDVLNGLFILMEDQYNKGDVVKIAGVSGLVEDVNLRRTILRDLDGAVHTIPNSEVRIASNYTKEWSRVNLDIPVGYDQDLDRAISVINRVGKELSADKDFTSMIISTPTVFRVEKFGDTSIELKVLGETKPLKQWDVMSELRKRIKQAFKQEGIKFGKGGIF